MPNVLVLIKSVFNKNCNPYYETFLEQCSHKNIKMLYYGRIQCSEGIDVNKTSASFFTIGIL